MNVKVFSNLFTQKKIPSLPNDRCFSRESALYNNDQMYGRRIVVGFGKQGSIIFEILSRDYFWCFNVFKTRENERQLRYFA